MGVAYGYTSTKIDFSFAANAAGQTSAQAVMMKHAVSISAERRVSERWSLQLAIGSALGGSVEAFGATHDILPGPFFSGGASYRLLDGRGFAPFVLASASLGASLGWTRQRDLSDASAVAMYAIDGRLGLVAGKTIAGVVSPYLALRAFGLPVFWTLQGAAATGTDAYHYQAGVGVSIKIKNTDLIVEGVPFGEKALTIGSGFAF